VQEVLQDGLAFIEVAVRATRENGQRLALNPHAVVCQHVRHHAVGDGLQGEAAAVDLFD
jgi:hypothetical protein